MGHKNKLRKKKYYDHLCVIVHFDGIFFNKLIVKIGWVGKLLKILYAKNLLEKTFQNEHAKTNTAKDFSFQHYPV